VIEADLVSAGGTEEIPMRAASWTMMAVLVAGSVVLAQGPQKLEPLPEKKAPAAGDEKLNGLLQDWENKMKSVDRFMVKCKRIDIDGLKGKSVSLAGEARYLKPNFALLDLTGEKTPDPKDQIRELTVSTGQKIYEFKAHEKLVRIHDMPKNGMAEEATFLNFLLGVKSDEVRKRYDLTLKKANDGEGYIYISIVPKLPADRQEFVEAELVLYSRWIAEIKPADPARAPWAMLPARIWFKAPNGDQSTWTFEDYDLKANLQAEDFMLKIPQGWKVEQAKLSVPPPKLKEDLKGIMPKQAPKSKLDPHKK
jgi:TIGR03009 family protein